VIGTPNATKLLIVRGVCLLSHNMKGLSILATLFWLIMPENGTIRYYKNIVLLINLLRKKPFLNKSTNLCPYHTFMYFVFLSCDASPSLFLSYFFRSPFSLNCLNNCWSFCPVRAYFPPRAGYRAVMSNFNLTRGIQDKEDLSSVSVSHPSWWLKQDLIIMFMFRISAVVSRSVSVCIEQV